MKTRRDFECQVDEVDPLVPRAVRCMFVWGDHDEHRCDALDGRDCGAASRRHHICGCGAAVWEQR